MCNYFLFLLSLPMLLLAQNQPAVVKEYQKTFITYPFSDPNPIPVLGRIYPYYRFDGFTNQPIKKEWRVVELENDYLRVLILPEIGGKIWTAIEKSTGRPFIYYNQAVKFRDIAMRGPWTSGGIEANYGIIGHTPNCATPVDYVTLQKEDGSVSCCISTLDLLTRTCWCIDINLPRDKAYFTTTSFWQNSTPIEQPYYTWMNAGIKAKGNLQLIYPGDHYLGHDGKFQSWPIHEQNHKDLSFYENNNFGSYKSYHVLGQHADFYGAYWHEDDFGMARYAPREEKLGKKIWIWGLAQQGMIWEKLLTDRDGQYVEVQSGRLFNQSAEASTLTPFKHMGFTPYGTDTWTEYWFPVKGSKGFIQATPWGAFNVMQDQKKIDLYFSPVQHLQDTLFVYSGQEEKYRQPVTLQPMQTWHVSIPFKIGAKELKVCIGRDKLIYAGDSASISLKRPLSTPADFNWNANYGLYLQGKELIRQREYGRAAVKLDSCLLLEPNYLPALVEQALLYYRSMQYTLALTAVTRALSIDTYDGAANYYYGLIHRQLGNRIDSRDGFEVAGMSAEYRTAAFTELAKLDLFEGAFNTALAHAEKAQQSNQDNLEAVLVRAVALRRLGQYDEAGKIQQAILQRHPLHHLARFEKYLCHKITGSEYVACIRNELPHETFIEGAVWYYRAGCYQEAEQLLQLAPQQPEVLYWSAFIKKVQYKEYASELAAADRKRINLQFPFRAETAEVLKWAIAQNQNWQRKYYLALIYASAGNQSDAVELLNQCGQTPDQAAFYAFRAGTNTEKYLTDMTTAARLDSGQWRLGQALTGYYTRNQQYDLALQTAQQYYSRFPQNYILGLSMATCLFNNRRYQQCVDLLNKLELLPCEGATDSRRLYRAAQLLWSAELFHQKHFRKALQHVTAARRWPENLGVGKPYEEDIDERLEDWLASQVHAKLDEKKLAHGFLRRIIDHPVTSAGANDLLVAWAMRDIGRPTEADEYLQQRIAQEPRNRWLPWCKTMYKEGAHSFPEWVTADENGRILAEWLKEKP
jgi:hypothetical protein